MNHAFDLMDSSVDRIRRLDEQNPNAEKFINDILKQRKKFWKILGLI